MTRLQLLPVVVKGDPPTRTTTDRLELLTALIAAPTFESIFRCDVIVVPRDHPTYGWMCRIPACECPQHPRSDYCESHLAQWRVLQADGKSITDFLGTARPVKPRAWVHPPPCLICPGVPAWSGNGLCYLHGCRWAKFRSYHRRQNGVEFDFDVWLARQEPFAPFGPCQVGPCPELADNPLQLCRRHSTRYERDNRPGGATAQTPRWRWDHGGPSGTPISVTYEDRASFDTWCREVGLANRSNGKLSLTGLRVGRRSG